LREFTFGYPAVIEELHVGRHRLDAVQDLLDVSQPKAILCRQRPAREPAVFLEQPLAKLCSSETEVDRGSDLLFHGASDVSACRRFVGRGASRLPYQMVCG